MAESRFLPFKETNAEDAASDLATRFAEDGYLFVTDLIEKSKIERARCPDHRRTESSRLRHPGDHIHPDLVR